MNILKITIALASPLGTPLTGDSLFGQLCWAIRLRHGEARLGALLDGYTSGRPFAILSDAFPSGYLPRPAVSDTLLGRHTAPTHRKQEKLRQWLPVVGANLTLSEWLAMATELPEAAQMRTLVVTQNTINRMTGTTGRGPFAPRQVSRLVPATDARLDLYVVLDEERLSTTEIALLIGDIGSGGYGRDASTGLGKFEVLDASHHTWPVGDSRFGITLAPCAPEPDELDASGCLYTPLTRFGRHGNVAALSGSPYKRPVLLMQRGALLRFNTPGLRTFHGRGLGGSAQPISAAIPQTVHQGYAPLVPIAESKEGNAQ